MFFPRKALIIRPRFLGDLILATGLAEAIKHESPSTEVWFLAESAYAPVLEGHPLVSGVLGLDASRKNDPFYLFPFLKKLRTQKFDAVLDLFGNPRTAQWTFFSGAPIRIGFDLRGRTWAYTRLAPPVKPPFPSGRRPVVDIYSDQLKALGFSLDGGYRTSLQVTDVEKEHAQKILERAKMKPGERLAVFCPGASWPAKHWPLERFVDLARLLSPSGVRPLFLFGPKETDLVKVFEEQMEKDWLLVDRPSLRGLMAFIEAADILISNDSGPMHVGPAVGTPTLGIFGPGEPEIWFPYPQPHQTAYAEVPCSHCGLDRCPLMACMEHLAPQDMAQQALRMLGLTS